MEDEYGDEAARRDGNTENAQHKSPWPADGEPHAEEQRGRQVRRQPDHRGSTSWWPGGIAERGDRALTRGANRRHESRQDRDANSQREDYDDGRASKRRSIRRTDEARPRVVDQWCRQPAGNKPDGSSAHADQYVLEKQHDGDESRRASYCFQKADPSCLLGHPTANEDG